jgi:DNA-binding NtrC family response regulator
VSALSGQADGGGPGKSNDMLNRLLGESAQIRNVRDMVEALSLITADVTVLIQGESGTGKALLAHYS